MWTIMIGNPIDGLRLVGLFDSANEANDEASDAFPNDEYWVVKIHQEF